MKPNCYDCVHRGDLPGDCHSRCNHPTARVGGGMGELLAMFSGKRAGPVVNIEAARKLNVKGRIHGITNGWFNWPWNFDPVWLESCDGFEQKPKPEAKP